MGIGVALANGLVRGFTQNIEREMAKRASEREKLDLYTQTVLDASTKKNFSNANVQAISGMIQNARNILTSDRLLGLRMYEACAPAIALPSHTTLLQNL